MIHLYKSPVHTILDRNLNFVMKKISVLCAVGEIN